jgi:hypothetical protein
VAERVPLLVNRNAFNQHYLNTKQSKLGHMMTPLTAPALEMARCNCCTSLLHRFAAPARQRFPFRSCSRTKDA